MAKREYDFTGICVPKNLLKQLKEIKKEHRARSYREVIENWIAMEKSYKQLKKVKELRQFTKQDIDKTESLFEKIESIKEELGIMKLDQKHVLFKELKKINKILKNET